MPFTEFFDEAHPAPEVPEGIVPELPPRPVAPPPPPDAAARDGDEIASSDAEVELDAFEAELFAADAGPAPTGAKKVTPGLKGAGKEPAKAKGRAKGRAKPKAAAGAATGGKRKAPAPTGGRKRRAAPHPDDVEGTGALLFFFLVHTGAEAYTIFWEPAACEAARSM